ncbi:MAG: tRNA pseudouridine(55) synthase TruB [Actinomycetota bacterium]|nr:tRNA pseudouridine(55) synthase TruB [Actinomycetota bacterium]
MNESEGPSGVVVVDKPAGMTSHDVVDIVRKKLGTRRVGHAGTLDPDATGVLVVGVGRATRLLDYAQSAPKRYEAVARFGLSTATQDASGEVTVRRPCTFGRPDLESTVGAFLGEIEQIPPMVSAVKVRGERLYQKARRGEEVERPARSATIYRLELIEFFEESAGPGAVFDVTCSAGTYVRTLVNDIGERLGCGAHLVSLRRTEAGGFTERDAVSLDELSDRSLLPASAAVRVLPDVSLDSETAKLVGHGRPIPVPAVTTELGEGDAVALHSEGRLLGVYRRRGSSLVAERVVSPA